MIDNDAQGVMTYMVMDAIQASIVNDCLMTFFYGNGIMVEVFDQDEQSPNFGAEYYFAVLEDFREPQRERVLRIRGVELLKMLSGHSHERLMIWDEGDELVMMADAEDVSLGKVLFVD